MKGWRTVSRLRWLMHWDQFSVPKIYIEPTAEMVIVRFSSHPQAKNGSIAPTSLPASQALAENLIAKDKN
jgi:hypothetical protein